MSGVGGGVVDSPSTGAASVGVRLRVTPPRNAPAASLLVDARGLQQSGIGRYLRSILRHLLADPRFGPISLLGYPDQLEEYRANRDGPAPRIIPFPHDFYSPAAQVDWWRLRLQDRIRADVVFFPHYDVPLWPGIGAYVVTIQDLNHFQLPQLYPAWKRAIASRVLAQAAAGARRILVSSRSTRNDLLHRHPHVADKIDIIALGVEADFAQASRAAIVQGVSISSWQPYLLCVGNRKASKNLVAAVEALASLRAERPDLRLILAGQSFRDSDQVVERASALGVADAVVELGGVTDAELRGLYAGAECLLFPSLYEGFGLPPLEAMAMETPVIASDRASTPEVVGDAGLVVAPEGEALAASVRQLREQPQWRSELVRRGRERARELTWERTATATANALLEAAAESRGGATPPAEQSHGGAMNARKKL